MSYPQANNDPHLETLKQLLIDVSNVRETVVAEAQKRLINYTGYYRSGVFTKSAVNLAHYLALRQLDLRHLQLRLAQVGLSSLGRAESSVLSTLDAVIDLLSRATGDMSPSVRLNAAEYDFNRGHQLLDQHTIELFGPYYEKSKAHVMVTLGTDAAWDYGLINRLLEQGMTCARINCAHDDQTIWQDMIRNLRRAEAETGRSCRILMDLAGHKIRTGHVALGAAVRHLKVKRDELGNCLAPAQFVLVRHSVETLESEEPNPLLKVPVDADLFDQLAYGHYIRFKDLRHKHRVFVLDQALDANQWLLSGTDASFLAAGTVCELLDASDTKLAEFELGDFKGLPAKITLFQGDHLILTTLSQAGAPAIIDQDGQILKPAQIGCTLESAINRLKVGDPVWIDDGKLGAEVETITEEGALLRVTRARSKGVDIKSDKGINFPETDLGLPSLSDKDLLDLNFACSHADLIGFSFVESLADMENLIQELANRGATDLPIIAKIETNRAVKNLPDIVLGTLGRHSLGIMIARGDLAVELGSARLAEVQEELLWLCEAAHVPVIWATQVLESIAKKGTRSRPEFTDAAMAVRAECVMLNKGPYIVDALSALINVMDRMQAHQHKKFSRLRALHW